jgi:hypothetical protein
MSIILLRQELDLHTRLANQIRNETCRDEVHFGVRLEVEGYKQKYPRATHRPVDPTNTYNCHGLTFASRRTRIWDSSEIQKIIRDDNYTKLAFIEVLPGDIVVYWGEGGDAEHSGVVVSVDQLGVPMILGKWGGAHEVVHRVSECPYDASRVAFYRMVS